ncbi:ribonucleases P/MRP protein subunit POP1 [Culicoides brevitarsis]|uniref:ribonucleases P/MRP protein subunit POP1 n=1 Tax=Culicoides brevitarsis TaxID=469753 RepID=UPI00307B4A9C
MDSDKMQYDASLGGNIKLPDTISAQSFAAAHIKEIKELIHSINNPQNNKIMHQMMPNRMRRRAMTQNPKRLPRRYREIHIAQMSKSGAPVKNKRPSRKYRRRPSNLLRDYARRMRKNVWLETHIWHAKRFHVRELWGYKIPWTPCDRAGRAAYRAVAKHCLAQDISFYGCIEVEGDFETLKTGFRRICSQNCGLTITANAFIRGNREGNVDIFKADSYPNNVIGRVSFIWRPESDSQSRILWIWVHPSFFNDVLDELVKLFDLKIVDSGPNNEETSMDVDETSSQKSKNSTKKADKLNFVTKNHAETRNPEYKNENSGVRVKSLKDTINRFRLTGPLSHAVLFKALKNYENSSNSEQNSWFNDFSKQNPAFKKSHKAQVKYWQSLDQVTSPSELDPFIVIALNVIDPRLNRAPKRMKALPTLDTGFVMNGPPRELPKSLPESPLWSSEVRTRVLSDMLTTHEINQKRSKEVLVPGEAANFENSLQPVPLIVIQRPGNQDFGKKIGLGSGYDVIVPVGYGLSVWLNLIAAGARAGGVKETLSFRKEFSRECFEPDSVAGKKEADRVQRELLLKYFKKPPNHRINYTKLAIAKPFKAPWKQLLEDWDNKEENWHVLRDKNTLSIVGNAMKRRFNIASADLKPNMLIPVKLTMLTHGNPGDFSLICIPKRQDQRMNITKLRLNDHVPVYSEPLRSDEHEKERKTLKLQHQKLLKRLRSRRVRAKRRLQLTSSVRLKCAKADTQGICASHFKKMCQLWLPDNFPSIRNQCSRETIGYVTTSGFTLSEGKVTGIGYVAANGLEKLLKAVNKGKLVCLVRGTKTRNYRFATICLNES